MDNLKRLTAYDIKNKKKGVPMYGVTINKVSWGENRAIYIAKGFTEDSTQKLSTPLGLKRAEQAFADGVATKGEGWS